MTAPQNAGAGQGGGQGGSTDPGTGSGGGAQGQQQGQQPDPGHGSGAGSGGDDGNSELAAARAEAAKWKELSRKHEGTAKSNADAAKKLAEIEQGQLTESQKLQKQLEDASKAATAAELRAVRAELAVEFELPAKWAGRISGATAEEMRAAAEDLKKDLDELRGDQQQQSQNGRRTAADLRQGARQTTSTPETPDDALRRMAGYGR